MKWAKFVVALIGAAGTAAAQNDIILPHVVAQILPWITALGVYVFPNRQS